MPLRVPTDRKILQTIYDFYYLTFRDEGDSRESKVMVPVDCKLIAKKLGVDGDIVFGRLYFHLEKKYGYIVGDPEESSSRVSFFTLGTKRERHLVNFPLLASVLASLQEEEWAVTSRNILSLAAIALSVIALITSTHS